MYEAFTKAHLEVGSHTMSVHVPVTDLPDNQENGEYEWLDIDLAGTTSCVPWSLARSASGGSILLNEGDWPHTNATVEWTAVDTDADTLYDELVATVRVTAEHFGRYTCSGTLVGWCEYPRQVVWIEYDEDEQELDGNGLPGEFYLRFRACYTYRVPGEGILRLGGIGPKGIDGKYGLLNLAIQWTDDRAPAPFSAADDVFGLNETYREAVHLSPDYPVIAFECHEYRSDFNHNGVTDWCDVISGASADTNYDGIPDEGDQPPCRPPCCPPACNLADITGIGGGVCPDGQLTLDDILAFLDAYTDETGCPGPPPCNIADITGAGGPLEPPDGQLTLDDILAFTDAYNEGCPGAEG